MDEILNHFSDPQVCADLLKSVRWKDGIVRCPVCGSDDVFRHGHYQTCLNRYSCQACCRARGVQHAIFTERTGTVFAHSKLPLTKWCQIIYLWKLKHNASEIATEVGVTIRTAQRICNLLNLGVYTEYHLRLAELAGVVEGDEIYQKAGHKGGQGRVQADDRFPRQRGLKAVGRGTWAQDRPPILGLAQRSQKDERGRVQERAQIYLEVLPNVQTETIRPVIKAHVLKGSTFNSDEYEIYNFTGREGYDHRIVNHSVGEYARGDDYVNTMEGIWSIVRPFLRCFRGVAKKCLHLRVARIEFLFNLAALSSREILHRVFEFCAMAPGRYLRWIVKQRRALPATGCYL